MKPEINKNISIIGVAFDKGAGTRGVALGPEAIRYAGIKNRLEKIGYNVEDRGDLKNSDNIAENDKKLNLKNLNEVIDINSKLCNEVSTVINEGKFPLVLGGDHSIAIGSIAGAMQKHKRLGIVWFDAHGDINTDKTSPSGNIHGMPMAVALGMGHEKLTSIGGIENKLLPEDIVVIAARDLDSGERIVFKDLGIKVFTMHEIDVLGIEEVTKQAIEIASKDTDGIHLSFDVDGVDPTVTPGTGTRVPGGATYREANLCLEMLAQCENIVSAEFVEVNPLIDDKNKTAEMAAIFIGSFMGEWLI